MSSEQEKTASKTRGFSLWNTINSRLSFSMILIIVILGVSIMLVSNFVIKQSIKDQTTAAMQETAKTASNGINTFIENKIGALTDLAKDPALQSGDKNKVFEFLKTTFGSFPEANDTFYANEKGEVVANSGIIPNINVSDRPYFKAVMSTGKVFITTIYINRLDQSKIFSIVVPILNASGTPIGLIGEDIRLSTVEDLVSNIKFGKSGYGVLLDKTGLYIVMPPKKEMVMKENITKVSSTITPSLAELGKRVVSEPTGFGTYSFLGQEKIMAWDRIPSTGWVLLIPVTSTDFYSGLYSLLTIIFLAIIIISIISFIIFKFISRSITKPLSEIVEVNKKISEGDLNVDINTDYFGELGILSSSTKKMAENTRSVIQSLKGLVSDLQNASEKVKENATILSHSSGEVSQAASNTAHGAEEISKIAQTLSNKVNTFSSTTQAIAKGAEEQANNTE
ncbi:methyl-accepting chemotaxis protein, partial [Thermodesulfobium sp. 4217-1]|uniref:PDC sensor domain-containing protein n=1 Tax=Thermodesulfobium sp. 4217-1 TaxID=3120013 RepID=UPI0032218A1C